jgi:primase-polymerase (primpol)-like protein
LSYDNIPDELKSLRQWVNWKEEYINGKPTKIPLQSINGQKASVTNPLDWSSYGTARQSVQYCNGIGFVFTHSDSYCGVDLDAANNDDKIQIKQNQIYFDLASYSEISPSGKGLHIICKARLPGAGRRRNKIEIYDNNRFFTFTGNRVNDWQIEYRQLAIETLYAMLGNPTVETIPFVNEEMNSDDQTILRKCYEASNGQKFARLFSGDWQTDYGTLSQSEADFALFNIIAFYTRNREQIVRLFRQSGLGKREKAQRAAYMNYMLSKTFDRLPPKADIDALYNQRLEVLNMLNGVK